MTKNAMPGFSTCLAIGMKTNIHHQGLSQVTAAAVIPSPIEYIKVAAVKKVVVGFCGAFAWWGFRVHISGPFGCSKSKRRILRYCYYRKTVCNTAVNISFRMNKTQ